MLSLKQKLGLNAAALVRKTYHSNNVPNSPNLKGYGLMKINNYNPQ